MAKDLVKWSPDVEAVTTAVEDTYTYDQYVEAWKNIHEAGNWYKGALAAKVETIYGKSRLGTFAEEVGSPLSTVQELRKTWLVWEQVYATEMSKRLEISWSVHQVLASRDGKEDLGLLIGRARSEQWNTKDARDYVRETREKEEGPRPLSPAQVLKEEIEHLHTELSDSVAQDDYESIRAELDEARDENARLKGSPLSEDDVPGEWDSDSIARHVVCLRESMTPLQYRQFTSRVVETIPADEWESYFGEPFPPVSEAAEWMVTFLRVHGPQKEFPFKNYAQSAGIAKATFAEVWKKDSRILAEGTTESNRVLSLA